MQDSTTTLVNGVQYGPANELLQLKDLSAVTKTETRQYNVLGQLTSLQVMNGVGLDVQYTYSATQNNGQITKMNGNLKTEEVNYTYDSLTRLSTASTTGPTWGQSFVYDGWGNRTDQLVTKGSAPVISVSVDPATNRITSSGYTYEARGT